MKTLTLIILSLLITRLSYSQIDNKKASSKALPWVYGNLPANSNKVNYKVVQGDGAQLPTAQQNAIKNLLFDLGAEKGVKVSSKTILKAEEQVRNDKTSYNSTYKNQITINQDGFNVSFYKVDEYYEKVKEANGSTIYRCWQLFAIGNNLANKNLSVNYTTNYGMNVAFRSMLIPGWGQLYKKDKTKGFLFIGIEAVAVGNIIFAQSRYNYNSNRAAESQSLEISLKYNKRADDNLMHRNISIGVAVVTMIWSVIDAVATDGAPRYASKNNKFKLQLTSNPSVPMALGLCYNFKISQ